MRRFFVLAGCLFACASARADALAEQVIRRLAEYPVVRARFEQQRESASLPKPAVSSGRLVASRKDGILWQVESPVTVTLAFGPQGIVETGPDGVRRLVAPRRGAVQAEMGRIMQQILSADIAQLGATFQLEARGTLERWTLRLTPKTREMARFLSAIELGGAKYLESIELGDTGGDRTTIRMRDFATSDALEPGELQQFTPP